jgi:hypothetical protein
MIENRYGYLFEMRERSSKGETCARVSASIAVYLLQAEFSGGRFDGKSGAT